MKTPTQQQNYKKVRELILKRFLDESPKRKINGCLLCTGGSHLSFKTTSGKFILIKDHVDGVYGVCDEMNIYGQYEAPKHLLAHGAITQKEYDNFYFELANVNKKISREHNLERLQCLANELGYTIKPNKTKQ